MLSKWRNKFAFAFSLSCFQTPQTNVNILHMNLQCSHFVSPPSDLKSVKSRGDPG